jgi:hypothetical protein
MPDFVLVKVDTPDMTFIADERARLQTCARIFGPIVRRAQQEKTVAAHALLSAAFLKHLVAYFGKFFGGRLFPQFMGTLLCYVVPSFVTVTMVGCPVDARPDTQLLSRSAYLVPLCAKYIEVMQGDSKMFGPKSERMSYTHSSEFGEDGESVKPNALGISTSETVVEYILRRRPMNMASFRFRRRFPFWPSDAWEWPELD